MIPGTSAVLNLDEIHIGSEFQNDLNLQHHTGFVGAMQKFVFNGKHFFEVAGTDQVESIEITARYDIYKVIKYSFPSLPRKLMML